MNSLLRYLKPCYATKRNFSQVGIIMSVPARAKISSGEVLAHAVVMMAVFLAQPILLGMLVPKWRKLHSGEDGGGGE